MNEVVASIKRMMELMAQISLASGEQSASVFQVGEAIIQMDQATQQNAALVEEMAAAAGSLKTQAEELVVYVTAFRLSDQTRHVGFAQAPLAVVASKPTQRPARDAKSAVAIQPSRHVASMPGSKQPSLTMQVGKIPDDGWSSF